jgi:hypothetical protein
MKRIWKIINDIIKTNISSHPAKIFLVAASGFKSRKIPTGKQFNGPTLLLACKHLVKTIQFMFIEYISFSHIFNEGEVKHEPDLKKTQFP